MNNDSLGKWRRESSQNKWCTISLSAPKDVGESLSSSHLGYFCFLSLTTNYPKHLKTRSWIFQSVLGSFPAVKEKAEDFVSGRGSGRSILVIFFPMVSPISYLGKGNNGTSKNKEIREVCKPLLPLLIEGENLEFLSPLVHLPLKSYRESFKGLALSTPLNYVIREKTARCLAIKLGAEHNFNGKQKGVLFPSHCAIYPRDFREPPFLTLFEKHTQTFELL